MKKYFAQTFLILLFGFYFSTSKAQNEDFELAPTGTITSVSQINGWSIFSAVHSFTSSNCALPQVTGTPSSSVIYSTTSGYIDPIIGTGYPVFSVFGSTPGSTAAAAANPQLSFMPSGNSFLRLNSSNVSTSRIEMARKVIAVTNANSQFDIAYVSVLQGGHGCCDAAAFTVKINNGNCAMLATVCSTINNVTFYNTINHQPVSPSNPAQQAYNKWMVRTIDLSMFVSQTVTVDIIAAHCTLGGHFAYAYLDTQFRPSTVIVNGTTTTLTANSVNTITSCSSTMTLSAPPNFSNYQWTGPGGFTSTLSTISTSLTGNYFLGANNGNACSAITNSFFLTFPTTTLQISASNSIICQGNSATLSVNGVNTPTWYPGLQTSSSITVSPSATTIYTVNSLNASGCLSQGTLILSVINASNLTPICNTPTICSGSSATINVVATGTPTWFPGLQTGASVVVTPSTSTIYTVNSIGVSGCIEEGTIAINIFTSSIVPLMPFSSTPSVCLGATASIAVSANGTTTWQPGGQTTSVISVSPLSTSIYTVSAINNDGCLVSGNYTLYVESASCASISTSDYSILSGNSATLTVFGLNTYTWQTGVNSQSIVVSPLVTTDYSVHGNTSSGAYGVAKITQLVEGMVGVQNANTNIDFKFFPNPASNELIIQIESESSKLTLYDLSGRLVIEKNFSSLEKGSVDVSRLDRGLYQITLISSKGVLYKSRVLLE